MRGSRGRARRTRPGPRFWVVLVEVFLLSSGLLVLANFTSGSGSVAPPSGSDAPAGFVLAALPLNVTLSPTSGYVGSVVNASGSGFPTGPLNMTFGSQPVTCLSGSLNANATGNFSCDFSVPSVPAGSYWVNTTTGGPPPSQNSTSFLVLPPTLSVSPAQAQVSALVSAAGYGFAPNSSLTLTLGTATVTACPGGGNLTSNATGDLACTFRVPALTAGSYMARASDAVNSNSTAFVVEPPTLGLNPTAGPVGSNVNATGHGFAPNYGVSMKFGLYPIGTCLSGPPRTDGSGNLNCTFTVPTVLAGPYSVTVSDPYNSANSTFTVGRTTLNLSPTSGVVGSSVTARGQGFAHQATVTLTFGSRTISSCASGSTVVNNSGGFSCTFSVPYAVYGAHSVNATDGVNTASQPFSVLAHLGLSRSHGANNTPLVFTGTGFNASGAASVSWNSTTSLCHAVTNSTGSFVCGPVSTPANAPGGVHTMIASQSAGLPSGSASFTVDSNLSAAPSQGPAGTIVAIIGSGFDTSAAYAASFNGNSICGSGSTNSTGSLVCEYTVNQSTPGGTYTIRVQEGSNSNVTLFTVEPMLLIFPSTGTGGTVITLTGSGLVSQTSYFYCLLTSQGPCPGGTPTSFLSETNGSIPANVILQVPPPDPVGTYYVDISNGSTYLSQPFSLLRASLGLSSSSGIVGSSIELQNGSGYQPFATYQYCLQSNRSYCPTGTVTNFTATANRTIPSSLPIVVPVWPGGTYWVDVSNGTTVWAYAQFVLNPSAQMEYHSAMVGTPNYVQGSGFNSSEAITFSFGPTLYVPSCAGGSLIPFANGTFICLYYVPIVPGGPYTLTFSQPNAKFVVQNFTVNPSSPMLTPSDGTAGTIVNVTGTGFDAQQPYVLTWVGTPLSCVPAPTITAYNGTFACSFTVPTTAVFGPNTVTVTEGTYIRSSQFAVGLAPSLRVVLGQGAHQGTVGTVAEAVGTGFNRSTPFTLEFGSSGSVTNCMPPSRSASMSTNSSGAFDCYFKVPPSGGGPQTVIASQTVNGTLFTATSTFIVLPSISLDPSQAKEGSTVSVRGTGFAASNASLKLTITFTVSWAGTLELCQGTTAPNGNASCQFTVPTGPTGTYEIFVNASQGPGATVVFTRVSGGQFLPRWALPAVGVVALAVLILVIVLLVRRSRRAQGPGGRSRSPEAPPLVIPEPPAGVYGEVPAEGIPGPPVEPDAHGFPGPVFLSDGAETEGADGERYATVLRRVEELRAKLASLKGSGSSSESASDEEPKTP